MGCRMNVEEQVVFESTYPGQVSSAEILVAHGLGDFDINISVTEQLPWMPLVAMFGLISAAVEYSNCIVIHGKIATRFCTD